MTKKSCMYGYTVKLWFSDSKFSDNPWFSDFFFGRPIFYVVKTVDLVTYWKILEPWFRVQ